MILGVILLVLTSPITFSCLENNILAGISDRLVAGVPAPPQSKRVARVAGVGMYEHNGHGTSIMGCCVYRYTGPKESVKQFYRNMTSNRDHPILVDAGNDAFSEEFVRVWFVDDNRDTEDSSTMADTDSPAIQRLTKAGAPTNQYVVYQCYEDDLMDLR
jgi:hypothetical protein